MKDILTLFGHPFYAWFSRLLSFGLYVVALARSTARNLRRGFGLIAQVTAYQIYFTCIQALPIIFFLSFFVVGIFISQADNFIGNAEGSEFVANLFVVIVIRELAPLLTALIVIGRSGTAIASEMASMVCNEEISALRVMGVDPYYYLVLPRLIGVTASVICMSGLFSVLGLFFTMAIGYLLVGIAPIPFLDSVAGFISGLDLWLNLLKSILFGVVIALVCTFWGLSVRGATTEIPQATTSAVISSVFWCFVLSSLVTIFIY